MTTLGRYPRFQQAYLVNDLETSIRKWHALYGAGQFVIAPHHKTDRFTYRGTNREADVSYAFGYLGDTMIQFIEQHDAAHPRRVRDLAARTRARAARRRCDRQAALMALRDRYRLDGKSTTERRI